MFAMPLLCLKKSIANNKVVIYAEPPAFFDNLKKH
jgi:hypothetical protein